MRWKSRSTIPAGAGFQRVFLWCPRRIGHHWYWLERVERRPTWAIVTDDQGQSSRLEWAYQTLRRA